MRRRRLQEVKTAVSEMFELPKDVMLNLPRVSMIGNSQMLVENHRGVIEYTPQKIRINSTIGVLRIEGQDMDLKNIAADDIMITGVIKLVEF